MNKLQKNAPQGQYRLAQGSALGGSVATRQRPVRAKSFERCCPYRARILLSDLYPGRCPGLGDVLSLLRYESGKAERPLRGVSLQFVHTPEI